MAKIVIPFELDADDVNALDGTPVTLATLTVDDKIVVVPVRLEIFRETGTAYSVTEAFNQMPATDDTVYFPGGNVAEPIPQSPELIVYDLNTRHYSGRTDRNNILFRVPMHDFLNTATANGLVVFPESGLVLRPGDTTIKIEALAGLASGTGSVVGRLHLDEFPV